MVKIGFYDFEDLLFEFKLIINFVYKVLKLFGDIKVDVMGFVNVRKYLFIFFKIIFVYLVLCLF